MSIPTPLQELTKVVPSLNSFTKWQIVRSWPLCSVWRASNSQGETHIVKFGSGSMKRELKINLELVQALSPKYSIIEEATESDDSCLLILRDLGTQTLEMVPEPRYFLHAAKILADIKNESAQRIKEGGITHDILHKYLLSKEHLIAKLDNLVTVRGVFTSEHLLVLIDLQTIFSFNLDRLYSEYPICLNHNDYFPKNLMIQPTGCVFPIDWANTNLSPNLGDLYGLVRESRGFLQEVEILQSYMDALSPGSQLQKDLEWQLVMGGICWYVDVLNWLVQWGFETIPGSREWIPGMLEDFSLLVMRLKRMSK